MKRFDWISQFSVTHYRFIIRDIPDPFIFQRRIKDPAARLHLMFLFNDSHQDRLRASTYPIVIINNTAAHVRIVIFPRLLSFRQKLSYSKQGSKKHTVCKQNGIRRANSKNRQVHYMYPGKLAIFSTLFPRKFLALRHIICLHLSQISKCLLWMITRLCATFVWLNYQFVSL